MSTGKRLAKRSIIGTRVCAPAADGKFYSGVIQSVKSPAEGGDAETRYAVRFDAPLPPREFSDQQLIGPGFQTVVSGIRRLVPGQRVYLTYNGREVSGEVSSHDPEADEVLVCVQPPGHEWESHLYIRLPSSLVYPIHCHRLHQERPAWRHAELSDNNRASGFEMCAEVRRDAASELSAGHAAGSEHDAPAPLELRKRLDELRLLESRKSARLMDQDTDFARLADMAGDRKRPAASHSIDVPHAQPNGSRKRRPSSSHDDVGPNGPLGLDFMDECTAALVLMSLSCSPHSPHLNGWSTSSGRGLSPSPSASDGGSASGGSGGASGASSGGSWRSATPSPPLSDGSSQGTSAFWASFAADEGIGLDDEELPRKRKAGRVVFQCTWPGCSVITTTCSAIESHVRKAHLGSRDAELGDREEEFYYTEVQLGMHHPASSPPTLSHRDMARPPHEDPEYQRQLKQCQQRAVAAAAAAAAGPINIPPRAFGWSSAASSPTSPQKHLKLSPRSAAAAAAGMAHPGAPHPAHHQHAHHPSPAAAAAAAVAHHHHPSSAAAAAAAAAAAHHFPGLSLSAPNKLPGSPTRKLRGDTKKCRKVYGMEHRELWCTQCKWKKACTRFGD